MELSIPREFLVENEKKDVRILQWNILADGKRKIGNFAKKTFRRTSLLDWFSSKVVYYVDIQLHKTGFILDVFLKNFEIFRKLPKPYISGMSFNKKWKLYKLEKTVEIAGFPLVFLVFQSYYCDWFATMNNFCW